MSGTNKVVWVVGGASGIGRAAVGQLLERDYIVAVSDCQVEKLNQLAASVPAAQESRLALLFMDMTIAAQVKSTLQEIKRRWGSLDAVVICAGVHSAFPVESLSDEIIERVVSVNLSAHIRLVRDVLPLVKDGGRVIALSSIAAGVGIPMSSLYSATKAGLEMFYESLSVEVSYRKIKCVVIHPGNVNTGFNETGNDYKGGGPAFVEQGYRRVVEKIHSRNGMPPAKVAGVIVKAVESPSPRFCYVVGLNALKAHWAKRLLGRDLTLKVMAKFFGF